MVSSFFLAVLVFETFEKWYLKLSSTSVGILVVALFFQNIVLINKDLIMDNFMSVGQDASSLDNVTDDMTLGED